MLKKVKRSVLASARSVGLFGLLGGSSWRRSRLLILGYHGASIEDEHIWDPELFMPPEMLRRRFEIIKAKGCTVLPLNEAVDAYLEWSAGLEAAILEGLRAAKEGRWVEHEVVLQRMANIGKKRKTA